jgi:hypothetical protein
MSLATPSERVVLAACRVMEPEIKGLRKERNHVEDHYLEQSLHRTLQKSGIPNHLSHAGLLPNRHRTNQTESCIVPSFW